MHVLLSNRQALGKFSLRPVYASLWNGINGRTKNQTLCR